MHKQHGSALTVTVIIILVVALLGALGFVFYQNFMPKVAEQTPSTTETNETAAEMKTFVSQENAISFEYPADWTATETVGSGSSASYYESSVTVKNDLGKTVAQLQIGGGLGGTCDPNSPSYLTNTTISEPVTIQGLSSTSFGYTLSEAPDGSYSAAYGLAPTSKLTSGEASVQCPGQSVNYDYVTTAENPVVGSLMFGLWFGYGETQSPHVTFASSDEAKSYTETAEFKTIETMIKSLKIGA